MYGLDADLPLTTKKHDHPIILICTSLEFIVILAESML